MTEHPDEDLLVELALGQAEDLVRDEVVGHLGRCLACRRDYDELAGAVELVLPAVPRLTPSPTFETQALARLTVARGTPHDTAQAPASQPMSRPDRPTGPDPEQAPGAAFRREPRPLQPARVSRRTVLLTAAAGVLGVALGAGVTTYLGRSGSGGAPVAERPRWAAPLVVASGEQVGTVSRSYGELGDLLVIEVSDGPVGHTYTCWLVAEDGSREVAGVWSLADDRPNSWVVPAGEGVAALELVEDSGAVWASAALGAIPPGPGDVYLP